jgi:hypothetical protein
MTVDPGCLVMSRGMVVLSRSIRRVLCLPCTGWRGATVLPRQREWRGNRCPTRGRSCRADACGAAACFGSATGLGVAKRVIFENKKATVLDLEFVL